MKYQRNKCVPGSILYIFFKNTELTRIHGEIMTSYLLTILNESKKNDMKVHTTLGGGSHGHLGLVIDYVAYDAIPHTESYVLSNHPGPLKIKNNATQYQISQLIDAHAENLRLFKK